MSEKKFKIVLADKLFSNLNIEEEVFKDLDVQLYFEKLNNEQELIEAAKDADGIMGILSVPFHFSREGLSISNLIFIKLFLSHKAPVSCLLIFF